MKASFIQACVVSALALGITAHAKGPAIADDVAGIRLGDARGIEDGINNRAKPWLRVYYDDQGQVQGVLYRQPGLGNTVQDQRILVNQICTKYGSRNVYCDNAKRTVEAAINDDEITFTGFTALYEVPGGSITARLKREKAFSLFPRLMVEIELERDGFEIPSD